MSKDLKKRKVKNKIVKKVIKKVDLPEQGYEQDLISRMEDCRTVVNDLARSPVWRVVYNDLQSSKQLLDDNWQNITDEKKLNEARIIKMANMHILTLKDKYQEELTALEADFDKFRNQDKVVIKDYDPK